MPGTPLSPPDPFQRRSKKHGRGRLPGTSAEDDLGLTLNITEQSSHAIISRDLVQVGNVDTGRYVEISELGIFLYADSQLLIALLAKSQTIESESLGVGDILMGSNASSNANLLWDKSAGQLKFRGGSTTELYIDTDGTLVAGAGDVSLNSDGLQMKQGTGTTNKIQFMDSTTQIVHIYGATSSGTGTVFQILSQGKNSSNPYAGIELLCWDYDVGNTVTLLLDTEADLISMNAATIRVTGYLQCTATTTAFRTNKLTTTQRDALSPTSGMIIFNTTTATFQGYNGSSWVTL